MDGQRSEDVGARVFSSFLPSSLRSSDVRDPLGGVSLAASPSPEIPEVSVKKKVRRRPDPDDVTPRLPQIASPDFFFFSFLSRLLRRHTKKTCFSLSLFQDGVNATKCETRLYPAGRKDGRGRWGLLFCEARRRNLLTELKGALLLSIRRAPRAHKRRKPLLLLSFLSFHNGTKEFSW